MVQAREHRRLAAVLAIDVVGYSTLVGRDESGTLAALRTRREQILKPLAKAHQGRIFKLIGDGALLEFPSAVDAVRCAVELQEAMAEANRDLPATARIVLRMGISVGDVVVEGGDLLGESVNLAARLEAIAPPGGIVVIGAVYDQVRRKVACAFDDEGMRTLKGLAEPVQVYRVRDGQPQKQLSQTPLPLPTKPSIAVLPFVNMSGNAQDEPFTDGLTEDLITDLSRHTGLFVIARHSTSMFKGKALDLPRIAGDLGVRYLLEGSARRAAGRVRVNVQLTDTSLGRHLWAERFDRSLDDIFAVQEEIAAAIAEALIGRLAEQLPHRNRPSNLQAYELCVRGRALIADAAGSPQAVREASVLLRRAIELDPDYADAHRWLAFNLWASWADDLEPQQPTRASSLDLAERSVQLDPNDAGCHWVRGVILFYEGRTADSEAAFARALDLDPSHADAMAIQGELASFSGRPEAGIESVQRALRLNPQPAAWYYWELAFAEYAAGRYEAAVKSLRQDVTYRTGSRRVLAAALAQLGRLDEARQEASLYLASYPSFSIAAWGATQPFRDPALRDLFIDGYRRAGLPD